MELLEPFFVRSWQLYQVTTAANIRLQSICFVMKRRLKLMEMGIISERREDIVISVVKERVERNSERKEGLFSEVTTSIGYGARGGTHSTMSGSSINVLRYGPSRMPSRDQRAVTFYRVLRDKLWKEFIHPSFPGGCPFPWLPNSLAS